MHKVSITYKLYHKYLFYINRLRIIKLKLLGSHVGTKVQSYGRFTVVNHPNLYLGTDIKINEGVHLNCRDIIEIGDNVHLSSNVQLHTGKLYIEELPRIHSKAPIKIGTNVWIASGVIVLGGVTIGENTVIAAGSVVTKDIPANVLVAGTPARIIRDL